LDKVDLKIDFVPNNKRVYFLLNKLRENNDIIYGDQINFTPNYITTRDFFYDENYKTVSASVKDCFCNGRYCTNSDPSIQASSHQILEESIRQKCLWNLSYKDINTRINFWDYMRDFSMTCLKSSKLQKEFKLDECSKNILSSMDKTLRENVDKCYKDSFISDADKAEGDLKTQCFRNTILENDSNVLDAKLKNVVPIIFVNNITFYGAWESKNVLEALCASLKDKPSSCYTNLDVFGEEPFSLSSSQIVYIIAAFVIFNIFVFFVFRRYTNKQINNRLLNDTFFEQKVGLIVTEYLKMKDVKK